jgi:hypothetical protein
MKPLFWQGCTIGGKPLLYIYYIHTYIIQLTPQRGFSVTDYIKYYAYVYYLLSLKTNYLYNNCDITFLTMFIFTHPVNFPCGRKPERPEKTQDFRQSVDWLFSREPVARIKPTF